MAKKDPKLILVCGQKGGTGKTMIADELAFSMERSGISYTFVDLDGQGSAIHHTAEEQPEDSLVTIVDTAGKLDKRISRVLEAADLVIVPSHMSYGDMTPLTTMIETVSANKKPSQIMYVLNEADRFKGAQAFTAWIDGLKLKSDIFRIPRSEMFVQAAICKKSVIGYAPRSSAATAMKEFVNAVRRKVKLPEEQF